MPESGCWAADFSREAGKNACRGRPPGRPGGTVYETGSLGRICTEARRGFAQFPSGEDFAGRRGRRPLRGDEGLCVGAALAAARAGKTWTKENRGRIRIQGMVRIRPRYFCSRGFHARAGTSRRPCGTGDDPFSHDGRPPRQLPQRGSQGRAAGGVGPYGGSQAGCEREGQRSFDSAQNDRVGGTFPIPRFKFRTPNCPTGFLGSGSCRNPPRRGGSRGRCSR